MWKDEVRRVEGRVCFQERRGQIEECAPCGPPFSLSSRSTSTATCGTGSDLFISTSSGCCGRISISAALQALSVRGFNRSRPFSPCLTVKTEPCAYHTISSSCYVSPTAPSHSVQHGHIVITLSSVTSIPNVVFFHFPTPQFPHKPPQ